MCELVRCEQIRNMFFVYILASRRNGTLYVGHTDNLARRISQHRSKVVKGFTAEYGVDQLVWFQSFESRSNAFRRERQIKEWHRAWKLRLIEATNPGWLDQYEDLNNLLPL